MDTCRTSRSWGLCWNTCHWEYKVWTIVAIIKGVFICFNIPLSNGYRQYYSGVNNITGYKKEVLTQILKKSPLVFLTHCYGLALNLPADGTITVERFWRDAMDTNYRPTLYTDNEVS